MVLLQHSCYFTGFCLKCMDRSGTNSSLGRGDSTWAGGSAGVRADRHVEVPRVSAAAEASAGRAWPDHGRTFRTGDRSPTVLSIVLGEEPSLPLANAGRHGHRAAELSLDAGEPG